jgi:3'-phosphoadenosine 5'-phosphosulfate sulfotransferase (PAPS reductase)/FAD synthetase
MAPDEGARLLPEKLSPHLQALEAESIYILREVAAQFTKLVLLYSIGKDSLYAIGSSLPGLYRHSCRCGRLPP